MIIVTGAAGFIGSNVVAALNELGRADIVLCDRLGQDLRWMNLRKSAFRNFLFPDELLEFLEKSGGVDCIIHMGANSSTTAIDGDEIVRSNFQFSLRLLDWCAISGTPLIYASSAATYGAGESGFVEEFDFDALRRLRPLNLYGWSKHQFDLVVAERKKHGLPLPPKCIGLKFFNVYGPNEYHKGSMLSVIARNYETARSGGVVELFKSYKLEYSDGEQRRDFVYIDDVVRVILWSMESNVDYGIFNVGTGKAATFNALVEALFRAVGQDTKISYVEMPEELRERYQYFTEASLLRLRNAGYAGKFKNVGEGVGEYVERLMLTDSFR